MQKIKINYKMLAEEKKMKEVSCNFELRRKLLKDLYKQDNKQAQGQGSSARLVSSMPLSHPNLEKMYFDVVAKLSREQRTQESYRTFHEKKFSKLIKRITKVKFYYSYWIGSYCVDIFIPRYRLVIEADGGIHNDEIKMKKDIYREKELGRLYKISVARFCNADISHLLTTMMHLLDCHPKLNSKAVKKLKRDIYINTLAQNCSLHELNHYLGNSLETNQLFLEERKQK